MDLNGTWVYTRREGESAGLRRVAILHQDTGNAMSVMFPFSLFGANSILLPITILLTFRRQASMPRRSL